MSPFEIDICNKIRSGDEKAFEYIFKKYYSILCIYASDLVKNDDLAEDVVHETLIRIWENRTDLTITTSLHSYLYRSVHNNCINRLKHMQVARNQFEKYTRDALLNAELMLTTDEDYTLEPYFFDGFEACLEDAINSLPEQCAAVFKLSRFGELSYQEIASKLNISVNTVKTQIGRALDKLRIILHEKQEENPIEKS